MAKFGKPFSLRMPKHAEDRVRALAAERGQTVSQFVRLILADRLGNLDGRLTDDRTLPSR